MINHSFSFLFSYSCVVLNNVQSHCFHFILFFGFDIVTMCNENQKKKQRMMIMMKMKIIIIIMITGLQIECHFHFSNVVVCIWFGWPTKRSLFFSVFFHNIKNKHWNIFGHNDDGDDETWIINTNNRRAFLHKFSLLLWWCWLSKINQPDLGF